MRPQTGSLFGGELGHKIFRKAPGIAFDLLVEAFGGDAIEGGEFGIENDALASQDKDRADDAFDAGLTRFVLVTRYAVRYGVRCASPALHRISPLHGSNNCRTPGINPIVRTSANARICAQGNVS